MLKKVLRGGIELGPEAKTVSDQYAFFRKQIKIAGFLANDDYISIIDTQENVHLPMEVKTNHKKSEKNQRLQILTRLHFDSY